MNNVERLYCTQRSPAESGMRRQQEGSRVEWCIVGDHRQERHKCQSVEGLLRWRPYCVTIRHRIPSGMFTSYEDKLSRKFPVGSDCGTRIIPVLMIVAQE